MVGGLNGLPPPPPVSRKGADTAKARDDAFKAAINKQQSALTEIIKSNNSLRKQPLFPYKLSSENPYERKPVEWAIEAFDDFYEPENLNIKYSFNSEMDSFFTYNLDNKALDVNKKSIFNLFETTINTHIDKLYSYLYQLKTDYGDESTLMAAKNTMTNIVGGLYGLNNHLNDVKFTSKDKARVEKFIAYNLSLIGNLERYRDVDQHDFRVILKSLPRL